MASHNQISALAKKRPELLAAYRDSAYRARVGRHWVQLRVGSIGNDLERCLPRSSRFSVLTGFNPDSSPKSPRENL